MDECFLDVNGVRLRVCLDGHPNATPLALVNGAYSNVTSWTPVMEPLAARYRVIRHDWRGTGKSSGGPRADYTFPQYADDLAGILDRLDVPRVVLCGLAYGARTAARFALRHPGRVKKLALFDVSLDQPVDQELQKVGNQKAKALRDAAGLRSPERAPEFFAHDHPKEAMRSLTAHRDQPDPTGELAACTIPTLVACGRQDVNLSEAERIAGVLPNAELRIMEMAGHGSQFSRPDLVAQYLIEFADP
ncbi:MAG: alpha/beta hydrolase [Myxococcales bacterium]|nr:alpha/beta hydrolase [Myxococcales bacterium]